MKIIIKDDYKKMSKAAADIIADIIRKKPDCVLGLATGSTPIGTYEELVRMHKEEDLDFSDVKTFSLDEYLGIGMDLSKLYDIDQSYARFMHEELYKHLNLKKENIHIPDGMTKDPEGFCAWYEAEIKKCGGIDIQLLGLGGDGHWAFNEPGSSLASRTRVQALAKQTIDDNYNAFYKKAKINKEDMPHSALTMGIGTLLETKYALMIVNGIKKADVVAEVLEGCITSKITASAIQLHPGKVTVILDKPASSKLTWSIEKG